MFSLFETIDAWIPLPPLWCVVVWSALAGAVSMYLYQLLSPQHKLKAVQDEIGEAQKAMNDYDGELAGMWPLIGTTLSLSLKRVRMSLIPSLLAGLPMILLIVCFDHQYPIPATEPVNEVSSAMIAQTSSDVHPVSQTLPESAVAHRLNEIEFVPTPARDSIAQPQEFLRFGPKWMRGWMFMFMSVGSVSALVVRAVVGIQ